MGTSGKVILAVDDNVDNLDLLKRIVTPAGYTFHGCSDGRKFLPLLLIQPDLILLDVEMPDIDGFELCRAVRQRPETVRTPVLFVTGRNSHTDLKQAIAVGGNNFVVKPYIPSKLRARIDHWIHAAESGGDPWNATLNKPAPAVRANSTETANPGKATPDEPAPSPAPATEYHPTLLRDLRRGL